MSCPHREDIACAGCQLAALTDIVRRQTDGYVTKLGHGILREELNSLTADVQRLRQALADIAALSTYDAEDIDAEDPDEDDMCEALCKIHDLARRSLAATPPLGTSQEGK